VVVWCGVVVIGSLFFLYSAITRLGVLFKNDSRYT
jgi:hypothetical protein